MSYTQWATNEDGTMYAPVGKTTGRLEPGYYDIIAVRGDTYFRPVRARADALLKFPDSASKQVLQGIIDFWDREPVYRKYGLPFKRGILMWGPPGSGKTCTMQLVAREVVRRGGVVVTFNLVAFLEAYRAFRDIEPDTPMVVLMEDFETSIKMNESKILNLLDGVEQLDRVVFLASTNYPEKLDSRIINRPSRFDLVIKVPHPGRHARRLYLESLINKDDDIDVERYVQDTEDLSLAHLKELFVATVVLGCGYDETIDRLRKMRDDTHTSIEDDRPKTSWGNFL